jgi:hypothetical protein
VAREHMQPTVLLYLLLSRGQSLCARTGLSERLFPKNISALAHKHLNATRTIRPVSALSAPVRATFLVARRAQRGRRAAQATFLVARNLWS